MGAWALAEALQVNKTLEVLILHGNNISDEGAVRLAATLGANSKLMTLDLSVNSIGNHGAGKLADALAVNKTLTSLNLKRTSRHPFDPHTDHRPDPAKRLGEGCV